MDDDATREQGRLETGEVAELQALIDAQQAELDELRARLAGPTTSRRTLLKSAGVVGGLAALAGVAQSSRPEVAEAIEGHNVKYSSSGRVYMTVTGTKQGVIEGDTVQKGREGQIDCHYFQHKVESPRDSASGQASGARAYESLVVRKEIDKATPRLTQALITNEVLSEVTLRFWRISNLSSGGAGTEQLFFLVELTGATVQSQNWFSPDALQTGSGGTAGPMEEISFTFQTITWTYVPDGTTTTDSWQASAG